MEAYVSGRDLLDENGEYAGIIPSDDINNLSQVALDNLLITGREMIDAYCQKSFGTDEENIPSIVKLVNVQLVYAMLVDPSKTAESIEDYSYDNNPFAVSQILSRLDMLSVNGETIASRKKSIRAKVI